MWSALSTPDQKWKKSRMATATGAKTPVHGDITGPVIMIGFGSIGRGMIPLLERHFKFDRDRFVIIDPEDIYRPVVEGLGIRFVHAELSPENYRDILSPLLKNGEGIGFCVNVSVDTSSRDIMRLCRELDAHYIDTVAEPWAGFYDNKNATAADRTNYVLREIIMAEKKLAVGTRTAISCCGANPGMVSWFVKQALINIAKDTNTPFTEPTTRHEWAKLMQTLGVKGVHIAERDTQRARAPKQIDVFVNTWSVEGFISEGYQPAELGWGTHEKWMPENAGTFETGCQAAIYLNQPGAGTRVRTWCPTPGAQFGFLVTHN